MNVVPTTNVGYQLFHEGVQALAEIEANGFKMDADYLRTSIRRTRKEIHQLKDDLQHNKECRKFYHEMRKRYGTKTNLTSHDQVGQVLFGVFDYPGGVKTAKGHWVTDKNVLQDVAEPFVVKFSKLIRLQKALGTYLKGLYNEIGTDGCIHPFYNLHLARTFRSSADHPPTQQIPVRDEEVAGLIRPAFISRWKDGQIGEHDFSGIEVKVSGCYHQDPVFLKYVRDPKSDMHGDMCRPIYRLSDREMTPLKDDKDDVQRIKDIRYNVKNKFVFPEFYGDWYLSCARSLWYAIDRKTLHLRNGTGLKEHLKQKGIKKLGRCDPEREPVPGTFEYHMKQVEHDFWFKRFKVYSQWKKEWYEEYLERGFFDTLTGFRCSGIMNRKQAVNYPIQGSAFHCLLWCLIRIRKLLRKYHMKTLLIGQIHDSLLSDIYRGELKDYHEIAHQVMTVDLVKHWKDWIIVPMQAEFEVAPPGKSWKAKEKYNG